MEQVLLCLELRGDGVVKTYWSRSMPRYENFRNVLFFLSSAASSAFCVRREFGQYGFFSLCILAVSDTQRVVTYVFGVSHDCGPFCL